MTTQIEIRFIAASKVTKRTFILWWICAAVFMVLLAVQMPLIFDYLNPPASFIPWWTTLSAVFLLSIFAGIYFLFVSVPAFVKGVLPVESTRIPFNAKQRTGWIAMVLAFFIFFVGMLLIEVPIAMVHSSIESINGIKREHAQLIRSGVIPDDTHTEKK